MPNQTLYDNFSQVRQYIDQEKPDLSSYVTKSELSGCSYVTSADLPVINENIIPKETTTYTLGDSTYLYAATYTSRVKVGNNSQMYNDGGGITFSVNNNNGIRIGGSTFYPKTNKGYSNGSSTNYWDSTYTSRVDLNTNIALTSDGSGLFVKTAGNLKFSFDADSFHPYGSTYSGILDLGTSTRTWRSTYTSNLFTNTAYLQDTSYTKSIVPAETDSYTLGDTDHIYNAAYITDLITYSNGNGFYNRSDRQINVKISTDWRYVFHQNFFGPAYDNQKDLGQSSTRWRSTYTANLYADNIHNFIWTGTSAEYAALSDYTTYQFYLIENE